MKKNNIITDWLDQYGDPEIDKKVKNQLKQKLREGMENKVLYCAVVLTEESKNTLLTNVGVPEGWKAFAHHMTIQFGKSLQDLGLGEDEGKEVTLTVTSVGKSDMALAVKIEGYQSSNAIPHITVAINVAEGGKPVMSNKITDWNDFGTLTLTGVVKNILKN